MVGVRIKLGRLREGINLKLERARRRTVVHQIHVGKTAGTAVRNALVAYNRRPNREFYFETHEHDFCLQDVPSGDFCLFCIRDPITRFRSGFYSRKRKGQPRLYVPYSAEEKIAFDKFAHANDLAEALSASSSELRLLAESAMRGVLHVNTSYWDWFQNSQHLEVNLGRIAGVFRQEHLSADLASFQLTMGIEEEFELPQGGTQTHKNDYSGTPALSSIARENLQHWYSKDFAFLDVIESLLGIPYANSDVRKAS